ncbi:MAG: rod shape-determining protein MreD [Ignavibacteriae bacterium]|nr:rod shape-determining protein MreD [Ignavibacteriota bacterium]
MPILLFIPLVIIQLTIIPFISLGNIVPNLIVILLVYFTINIGQVFGTILGAIFGLFFDVVSGGILGTAMFSMTVAGFVAGYFYNENKIEYYSSSLFFLLIVFLNAFTESFIFLLISSSEVKLTASHLMLEQGVLPAIFTMVISLPLLLFNQRKKKL